MSGFSMPPTVDPRFQWPWVDHALACRIEATEGEANAAFVMARAGLQPEVGAARTRVAGAWCMFDGPRSPLTQTFGLGLFDLVGPEELETIERFFQERGAPVLHEVSPLADPSLLSLLGDRGYRPIEQSNVLFRPSCIPLPPGVPPEPDLTVREITPAEVETWAQILADGWRSEAPELVEFITGLGGVSARAQGNHCFLAEIAGEAVAGASIHVGDGVALLAGASTRPEFRRRGAQGALLAARLGFAAERGGELAVMVAAPGSVSQRNAERKGFRIAYTRTKWKLVSPDPSPNG
jgi:GNAT superfamily N-acetyltransferase